MGAAAPRRLAGPAARESLSSPFGFQPVPVEPVRDSRRAASEFEADLPPCKAAAHQGPELLACDAASRRMLGVPVRLEAVLADPIADGRRILTQLASDLREG